MLRLLISLVLLSQVALGSKLPESYHPTKLQKITIFEDLPGGRYVIGHGRDPQTGEVTPWAIYDKEFPRPYYGVFWRRALLGTIGIGDLSLVGLAKKWTKHADAAQKQEMLGQVTRTLKQGKDPEGKIGVFAADFWKSDDIPWKVGQRPAVDGPAPNVISFSAIDFDRRKDKAGVPFTRKLFDRFVKLFDDDYAPHLVHQQVLQNSRFQRRADGTYEVIEIAEIALPPLKVIDLRGKSSSLARAASWNLATTGIKSGLRELPTFGVTQTIAAFAERFFNFMELIAITRHSMVMTLVMEARDGNTNSPFYGNLSAKDLDDAVFYLLRTDVGLKQIFLNSVSKQATLVDKFQARLDQHRIRMITRLEDKNLTVYPFDNSYYALALHRNATGALDTFRIYSLTRNKLITQRPHEVVDFLHPRKDIVQRNLIDVVEFGLNYLKTPIPLLATTIRTGFREVAVRNLESAQAAEAGYQAHLDNLPTELRSILIDKEGFAEAEADGYMALAHTILGKRLRNPLDIEPGKEVEYRRISERWLKSRDPGYITWDASHGKIGGNDAVLQIDPQR